MNDLTSGEQFYLNQARDRLNRLREFLNELDLDTLNGIHDWFAAVAHIRAIQGNSSNDSSFLGCLLAKQYLAERFDLEPFDIAAKAQGAPGLDIDINTITGQRIIGELKTTVPYKAARGDLGANQKKSFLIDFAKLTNTQADYKYFFVTDQSTFNFVMTKYSTYLGGIEVVLLNANNESGHQSRV